MSGCLDGFRLGIASAFISVEPDLTGFDAKLKAAADKANATAKVAVDPDTSTFGMKLKAAVAAAARDASANISIGVSGDIDAQLRNLARKMQQTRVSDFLDINLNQTQIDQQLILLRRRLEAAKFSDMLSFDVNQTQIDQQLALVKRKMDAAKFSDMLSFNIDQAQIDAQIAALRQKINAVEDVQVSAIVDDAHAKAVIDQLKAQLGSLRDKMVRLTADDSQAKATIDELRARIGTLDEKVVKLTADSGQADLVIDALKVKLDTLHDKTVHVDVKQSGSSSLGADTAGLAGSLVGTGSAAPVNMLEKAILALNVATGVAEPALAALTVTVGALGAGFVAGGIGVGAFAAAVKPQISAVTNVMTLQTAAATGSAAAVKKYQDALAALSPAQKTFYTDLSGAKSSFKEWSDSLAGVTLKPLETGLGAVNPLLKLLTPFVKDAAGALNDMMTKLATGVKSNGFKEWLQTVEPLVKPTLEAIGTAIGHIATGLGGLIVAFAPFAGTVLKGIDDFTKRFSDWAKNLGDGKHTGFNALIDSFQQNWPLVKQGLGDFAAILKNVLGDVTGLATGGNSKALWEIANPVLGMLKEASSHPELVRTLLYLLAVKDAAGKIGGVFSGISNAVAGMQSAGGFLSKLLTGQNPFTSGLSASEKITAAFTTGGADAAAQIRAAMASGGTVAGGEVAAGEETGGAAGGAATAAGFGTALLGGGVALAIGAAIGVAIMRAASMLLNPPTKKQTDTYNQQVSGPFKTLGNLALGDKAPTFYNMVPGGSNTPNKSGFQNVWEGAFGTPSVPVGTHKDVAGAGSAGSAGASVPTGTGMTKGSQTNTGLLPGIWDTAYENFQRQFAGKITSWFTVSLPNTFTHSIPGWFDGAWGHFQSAVIAPVRGWITSTVPSYFTQTIPNWFKGAWAVFNSGVVHPIVNWFTSLPGWISSHISHIWDNVWTWFSTQASRISGWFSSLPGWVASHVSHIWDNIYTWFATKASQISGWFAALPGYVSSHVSSIWDHVYDWFATKASQIASWISGLPGYVSSHVASLWDHVYDWFAVKAAQISAWISGIPGYVASHVSSLWDHIYDWFATKASQIASWISGIPGYVASHAASMWDSVYTWFAAKAAQIGTWIGGLPGMVSSQASSMWDSVWTWFDTNVVQKIQNFITNIPQDIATAFSSLGGLLKNAVGSIPVIGPALKKLLGAEGGMVTAGGIQRLAAGGTVGTDTVPALLTPGERVLSVPQVAALGGHDAITQMAAGGVVGAQPAQVAVTVSGSKLTAEAKQAAQDVGNEWAKSGAKWFNTAQTSVKTNVTTPLTTLAATTIPAAFNKSVPTWYNTHQATLKSQVQAPVLTLAATTIPAAWNATVPKWYTTHAATLQSQVAAPVSALIGTTIPAAQNKAVPTWYNTHAATLTSKVTTPVTAWINSTVPAAQNKTVPHWYDTHPETLTSKVTTPVTTLINSTVPADWKTSIQTWFPTVAPTHAAQVEAPLNTYYKATLPTAITTGFSGAMTQVGAVANRDISALNAVTKVGGISPVGSLAFALGGVMPGYEPGKDTMSIMVGGGEGILVPEAVRGIGGAKAINAINRTFAGHRGAGYADGGVTGSSVASYATGVPNTYTWGGAAPPMTDCSMDSRPRFMSISALFRRNRAPAGVRQNHSSHHRCSPQPLISPVRWRFSPAPTAPTRLPVTLVSRSAAVSMFQLPGRRALRTRLVPTPATLVSGCRNKAGSRVVSSASWSPRWGRRNRSVKRP